MKFRIPSGDIVRGLSAVIGAVPNKATLPILEDVLFEAEGSTLKLTATDLEIYMVQTVEADISEDGKVAIPARRLLDTIRQLPDIPVTFDVDERNNIRFKTDKGTYKLAGNAADDFPASPSLEESNAIISKAEHLKEAIQKTSFAVASDDLRPAMMGVYFQIGSESSKVVATDGRRLARLETSNIVGEQEMSFIVPEKALNLVQKSLGNGECSVSVSADHARFETGSTIVITRLINDQYPNYESVIPRENDKTMKVAKDDMIATVKRVSIFSSSTTKQIRLELKANEVEICAEDVDMSSEAKESVPCEYGADEMVIGFNARYLSDVLGNVTGSDVVFEFSTPNRAGIVRPAEQNENEDMLMLVMPVMLNTYA